MQIFRNLAYVKALKIKEFRLFITLSDIELMWDSSDNQLEYPSGHF